MKRIGLTLLLTVCLLLTACAAQQTYTAEVTLYVHSSVSEGGTVGSLINSLTNSRELAESCVVVFTSRSFSERIADAGGCSADDVHSMLTADVVEDSALVRVTVTGHSKDAVARVIDAVVDEAAPCLKEISGADILVDIVSITYPTLVE